MNHGFSIMVVKYFLIRYGKKKKKKKKKGLRIS